MLKGRNEVRHHVGLLTWASLLAVAGGVAMWPSLHQAAQTPSVQSPGAYLAAVYRIDHLSDRPTVATDSEAAVDDALWDEAKDEGYRWADENAPDRPKDCEQGASAPAFQQGCTEWIAEMHNPPTRQ